MSKLVPVEGKVYSTVTVLAYALAFAPVGPRTNPTP
jgi:hypothetical protein